MRLFLLGDFATNNGPGNANKRILEAVRQNHQVRYSKQTRRILRILEAVLGVLYANSILICSKSQINYLFVKLANALRKPVYYVMHGFSSYEALLNGATEIGTPEYEKLKNYDEFIIQHTTKTICVSPFAMNYMKAQYPQFADKFDYVYNAVTLPKNSMHNAHKPIVLSVGADMRLKNCLPIVKAVELLRKNGYDYKVILIGRKQGEYEKIKCYDFVDWREPMSHEQLQKLMTECALYVQNSSFDTFALAPIEALFNGASIILSDYVGCKGVFTFLENQDIIHNPQNEYEIAKAINHTFHNGNCKRLIKGMQKELISINWMAQRLNTIMMND